MLIIDKLLHFFHTSTKAASEILRALFFFLFYRIYFAIFVLLNSVLWLSAFFIKERIGEPRIALHYNIDSGIDYYGPDYQIFILPILGFFVFLTNTIVFGMVRNQQDRHFIGHLLLLVAILCNVFLLVGIYSIYLINFK